MKFIIYGTTLSGKNWLQSELVKRGLVAEVSHTTRPMRKGEVDGIDYHFVDVETFATMKIKEEFFEDAVHRSADGDDYMYGTTYKEWEQSDVTILNSQGLRNIPEEVLKDIVVINCVCDPKVTEERHLLRGDESSLQEVKIRILKELQEMRDMAAETDIVTHVWVYAKPDNISVDVKNAIPVSVSDLLKDIYKKEVL